METLGDYREWNKYKIFYLIFMIAIVAFLAFSWIGQTTMEKKQMVEFYAWLGLVSIFFILFDNATLKRFQQIDTVTIERTPIHIKWILAGSIIVSAILGTKIFTTHQAWVGYPQFQFFDNRYANAILSGVAGIIENWFFFASLLPTIYALLENYLIKNKIFSKLISVLLISLIFMIYHIFVYATNEYALVSVFLFGLVNSLLVTLLRTIVVSDFLHFTNNFVASMVSAGMVLVW